MNHSFFKKISLGILTLTLVGGVLSARPTQAATLVETLPIVPTIDEGMKANLHSILATGQRNGHRSNVFIKVGDSITATGGFLVDVGCPSDPPNTFAGQSVIVEFFKQTTVGTSSAWCGVSNSFTKDSRAAAGNWRTNALLSVATGDPGSRMGCNSGENQLACEVRQSKPAFALIMIGTNDVDTLAIGGITVIDYKNQITTVVNQLQQSGVIPVLSTLPPRLDQNGSLQDEVNRLNQAIIEVAQNQKIPLWNYWRALQELGSSHNYGMDADGIHPSTFRGDQAAAMDTYALKYGYNVRNFTALQILTKLKSIVIDNGAADTTIVTPPISSPVPPVTPPVVSTPVPIPPVTSVPVPPVPPPTPVSTFTLTGTPAAISIVQGATGIINLGIQRTNFTSSVRFSYDRLPTNARGTFNVSRTIGNTARFTITVGRTVIPGSYTVNIRALSGSITRTIAIPITITSRTAPAADFTLSRTPNTLSIQQGQTGTAAISITRLNGFNGTVAITATGLPAGVTTNTLTIGTGSTAGTMTFSANNIATVGSATVTLRATSGSLNKTITLPLTITRTSVTPPPTTPTTPTTPTVPTSPEPVSGLRYDIGTPTVRDIWVSPTGNDNNTGASRGTPLATLGAAWRMIPNGTLTGTGYRIMMMSGNYPENTLPNYMELKRGTAQFPIIIQAADGRGTATLQGDLNIANVSHLYLIDLNIIPVPAGDAIHIEKGDHILMRGMRLSGGNRSAHETIKINQAQYIYLEDSDISGAYDNTIDYVAVQYGHIARNKISNADDWCAYVKGGSANIRVEGNEIFNCGTGGFTTGQGTGFEYMVSPWLHYEAYGITFVNNVIHDTEGAGIGVNGGYNIVMAYNTMYRVGSRDHVIEVVFGGRECDMDQYLPADTCANNLRAGGWGSTARDGEPIPNKNVYILNNIVYNPPGYQSRWQHFAIYNPRTASAGTNIPSPARTDDNLVIKGNIIWNGPTDHSLGLSEQACMDNNPTCNRAQLLRDNAINTIQPQLVNPAAGDFRPTSGSNIRSITAIAIPTLRWSDLPTRPLAPAGASTITVDTNRDGASRTTTNNVGAY